MPELPDITAYLTALESRILGRTLEHVRLQSVFVLRTADPPISAVEGRTVRELRRIGKRIAIGVDGETSAGPDNRLWLVIHLMIAGRLHWRSAAPKAVPRKVLALFQFSSGALTLTEAGSERRAALHVAAGDAGLAALDAGGIDALSATETAFAAMLRSANHTLKRALTDPHLFSGIGNAYSDEILHRARLSPIALTLKMSDAEIRHLQQAIREVLTVWTDRLRTAAAGGFPEKVTAFREGMAVHGRYGQPCPDCGSKIQRIRYRANETNYCPQCQTSGRLLADRALSRLLREDWPRTIEELEALKRR